MRFGGRYVLGIDALPHGRQVAVAVGRSIADTYEVADSGGRPLPLALRVEEAVAEARSRRGSPPDEIRLVCVDDGGDGDDLAHIGAWLADRFGSTLLVLDLVGPIGDGDPDPIAGGSVARAREAALW